MSHPKGLNLPTYPPNKPCRWVPKSWLAAPHCSHQASRRRRWHTVRVEIGEGPWRTWDGQRLARTHTHTQRQLPCTARLFAVLTLFISVHQPMLVAFAALPATALAGLAVAPSAVVGPSSPPYLATCIHARS